MEKFDPGSYQAISLKKEISQRSRGCVRLKSGLSLILRQLRGDGWCYGAVSLFFFFFLVFHTSDFIPLPLRLGYTVVRDGGHISPEEKRLAGAVSSQCSQQL